MPLYTYKCTCGQKTQVSCAIKDRQDVVECSKCTDEAKISISSAGLIAGRIPRYRSKRQEMDNRLAQREKRLQDMENSSPEGKKRAEQFRKLSRKLTNGKF